MPKYLTEEAKSFLAKLGILDSVNELSQKLPTYYDTFTLAGDVFIDPNDGSEIVLIQILNTNLPHKEASNILDNFYYESFAESLNNCAGLMNVTYLVPGYKV